VTYQIESGATASSQTSLGGEDRMWSPEVPRSGGRPGSSRHSLVIAAWLGATAPTAAALAAPTNYFETNASAQILAFLPCGDSENASCLRFSEDVRSALSTPDGAPATSSSGPPGSSLPPLEDQADVILDAEEWQHVVQLLKNPPKATPGLRRALARRR
jgi:hypothetical protein